MCWLTQVYSFDIAAHGNNCIKNVFFFVSFHVHVHVHRTFGKLRKTGNHYKIKPCPGNRMKLRLLITCGLAWRTSITLMANSIRSPRQQRRLSNWSCQDDMKTLEVLSSVRALFWKTEILRMFPKKFTEKGTYFPNVCDLTRPVKNYLAGYSTHDCPRRARTSW